MDFQSEFCCEFCNDAYNECTCECVNCFPNECICKCNCNIDNCDCSKKYEECIYSFVGIKCPIDKCIRYHNEIRVKDDVKEEVKEIGKLVFCYGFYNCKNYNKCKNVHKSNLCKFDNKCNKTDCTRIHSDQLKKCRYGKNCHKRNCCFYHGIKLN